MRGGEFFPNLMNMEENENFYQTRIMILILE